MCTARYCQNLPESARYPRIPRNPRIPLHPLQAGLFSATRSHLAPSCSWDAGIHHPIYPSTKQSKVLESCRSCICSIRIICRFADKCRFWVSATPRSRFAAAIGFFFGSVTRAMPSLPTRGARFIMRCIVPSTFARGSGAVLKRPRLGCSWRPSENYN